jgi:hypothetical protein
LVTPAQNTLPASLVVSTIGSGRPETALRDGVTD